MKTPFSGKGRREASLAGQPISSSTAIDKITVNVRIDLTTGIDQSAQPGPGTLNSGFGRGNR
jgi:hypothetical protein